MFDKYICLEIEQEFSFINHNFRMVIYLQTSLVEYYQNKKPIKLKNI